MTTRIDDDRSTVFQPHGAFLSVTLGIVIERSRLLVGGVNTQRLAYLLSVGQSLGTEGVS
jgi:hypothetical protein